MLCCAVSRNDECVAGVLQGVVGCCRALQCVARCCSIQGHECSFALCPGMMSMLQCVAVCCSVLQCVAVYCSVLQCVAVCCNVFQCVEV